MGVKLIKTERDRIVSTGADRPASQQHGAGWRAVSPQERARGGACVCGGRGVDAVHRWAPGAHRINLAEALRFLLKGANDAIAAALGLHRRESGARVIGKRWDWSENVGAETQRLD